MLELAHMASTVKTYTVNEILPQNNSASLAPPREASFLGPDILYVSAPLLETSYSYPNSGVPQLKVWSLSVQLSCSIQF